MTALQLKPQREYSRHIHLLYVPTLGCNLGCSYCYLGDQTTRKTLKQDAARATATLRHALEAFEAAGVLAFNVSLHGGEVTTMPPAVLEELFTLIRGYYMGHFDALSALGQPKSVPHIKTNLYRFEPLYDLFVKHKVSISASIDLPLSMHAKHRTTRGGASWLDKTLDNLRLLARYPHAKKISATLCEEHLADIPAIIEDIWFIHRELGFDMNRFNVMFAFESELNESHEASKGKTALTQASPAKQMELYRALNEAFSGTELEEGLRRHWFDEFKPSYCTSAFNCGERFFLLQSDGSVYSCVRGQGLEELHYGNVFTDSVEQILATGARKVSALHQAHGFDASCQSCGHLRLCRTGCPAVKLQMKSAKSYTCDLQKAIYTDHPRSFPADPPEAQQDYARWYARNMHPRLAFAEAPAPKPGVLLPNDLYQEKNTLLALIEEDETLKALYSSEAFVLEMGDERLPLSSQLLKRERSLFTLTKEDRLRLHVRRDVFQKACPEPIRNTLYLQMLRDTPVVYGDEKRTKQEHLFTYQLHFQCLEPSDTLGEEYVMADLGGVLHLHRGLYLPGVTNNLFVTTQYLREYHYQKQKNNAFYHIQAINLPFQNFEFYYVP
ncbi:radical SAM protein [Archangium sp. Cb G35]|uniref:radical SAM protein n=1 Tax=Archangium sp. Cb G35 TaxID=1920190 RepID=UPI000A7CAA08|nr:SPASM domain-containing protein [Archangium sp. Cb G35]